MADIVLNGDDKQRVRDQIVSAFDGVPMPEYDGMIPEHLTEDPDAARSLLEFAGLTPENMALDFRRRWWPSFSYLTPEAIQYYLPAILIAALDGDNAELLWAYISELTPSAFFIYYQGSDVRFDQQFSLFTPDQEMAVVAFLGLFLDADQPNPIGFRAGFAFRFGWDRDEWPALEPFASFYHTMHHFEWPDTGDPPVASLVNEIRAAFAETPYPGDNNLSGSEQGDEPAECALEFRGLDWRTIHPALLSYNSASLSFLTNEGFRYFLPAYLIADLMETESNADPIFQLTHGLSTPERFSLLDQVDFAVVRDFYPRIDTDEELREMLRKRDEERSQTDWSSYAIARMSLFDRQERQAIVHYLEHRAKSDDYSRPQIEEALERYWRPSLTSLAPG